MSILDKPPMTNNTDTNEPTAADRTVPDELVEQLQHSSVELATADPTAEQTDLTPVGDTLADPRVIGLGEATHGTREFFQLKHRLIRYLVAEAELRLLVMEANLPETMALNEYVVHGEGDPLEALAGTYFWVWRTEAVLALVEWLREFNATRPPDDRVRLYGIDAQYTAGAVQYLDAFLVEADPGLHEELRADLTATSDDGDTTDQHLTSSPR